MRLRLDHLATPSPARGAYGGSCRYCQRAAVVYIMTPDGIGRTWVCLRHADWCTEMFGDLQICCVWPRREEYGHGRSA